MSQPERSLDAFPRTDIAVESFVPELVKSPDDREAELDKRVQEIALQIKDLGIDFSDIRQAEPLELIGSYLLLAEVAMARAQRIGASVLSKTPAEKPAKSLTTREAEILPEIISGCTNQEIAKKFGLEEQTIKFHITNIYIKIGVKSRIQAIEKAAQLGLVDAVDRSPEAVILQRERITASLTERELTLLPCLQQGLSNKEIGERLYISKQTVKFHLTGLFGKLGVRNRTEAAILIRKSDPAEQLRLAEEKLGKTMLEASDVLATATEWHTVASDYQEMAH